MKIGRGKPIALLVATLAAVVFAVAAWLSWPHLVFWYRFEYLGLNEQRLPEYRHRQTGIVMVRVPGGTFWMGAQREDPNGENYDPEASEIDGPVHQVTLSPFLIGKYEVVQAEWERVMGSNPSHFHGEDLPVETVSWDDCQDFCQRTGMKLPSEAQWEYACRGGSPAPFCFGAGATLLPEYAWPAASINNTTHRVGEKRPNGFGLHDVYGNVWEWCEDIGDGGFYRSLDAGVRDPVCRSGSESRVTRGGYCRSALRGRVVPGHRDQSTGLRAAYWPLP